jgi:hypothetical protein
MEQIMLIKFMTKRGSLVCVDTDSVRNIAIDKRIIALKYKGPNEHTRRYIVSRETSMKVIEQFKKWEECL